MDSTTRILERRFATVLILRVMENPGCLKKDVVRMEPESTRVKGQTLDELIDYGIVCVE